MKKTQWRLPILGLKVAITLIGVWLVVMHFLPNNNFYKIWSYVITLGVAWVPDLFRLAKVRISWQLEVAYLVFLIPSMIFGIDFDWYRSVPMFDKIVHGASGVLTAFAANELLQKSYVKLGGKNVAFRLLMSVALVALVAVAWECFEFLHDILLDGHMQELISTGLDDTMWDMIWAMGGGILATLAVLFTPWDVLRLR